MPKPDMNTGSNLRTRKPGTRLRHGLALLYMLASVSLPLSDAYCHESKTGSTSAPTFNIKTAGFHRVENAWSPMWFQCETRRYFLVFPGPATAKTQTVSILGRTPTATFSRLQYTNSAEPDCGMMKCWWRLTSPAPNQGSIAIRESHYSDPASGFWTPEFQITAQGTGFGPEAKAESCRWYPRLRLVAFTGQDSIYITDNGRGQPTLRLFERTQEFDRAVLAATRGSSRWVSVDHRETFDFRSGVTSYHISVSANDSQPDCRLNILRNGKVIREETATAYTYGRTLTSPPKSTAPQN
jgi:hypothetical protein